MPLGLDALTCQYQVLLRGRREDCTDLPLTNRSSTVVENVGLLDSCTW